MRRITYSRAAIQVKRGKPVESKKNKHVKFIHTLTKKTQKTHASFLTLKRKGFGLAVLRSAIG